MKFFNASTFILLFSISIPSNSSDLSVCVACHNPDQDSNPIINGQHSKYIEKQLYDLKKDLRIHAPMQGIAKTLDDKQIKEISVAFASKKWESSPLELSSDVQDQGKLLVRKGNCTRCHGSELEGTYNIPRLAGQKSKYLKTTLLNYKNKKRNNYPAMSSYVNRYSEDEIGIMADYISGIKYVE